MLEFSSEIEQFLGLCMKFRAQVSIKIIFEYGLHLSTTWCRAGGKVQAGCINRKSNGLIWRAPCIPGVWFLEGQGNNWCVERLDSNPTSWQMIWWGGAPSRGFTSAVMLKMCSQIELQKPRDTNSEGLNKFSCHKGRSEQRQTICLSGHVSSLLWLYNTFIAGGSFEKKKNSQKYILVIFH